MRRLNGRASGNNVQRRPLPSGIKKVLPNIYLTSRQKVVSDVFLEEQGHFKNTAGFRWFLATTLAGLVGMFGIVGAIFATSDFGLRDSPMSWSETKPTFRPKILLTKDDTGKTDRESSKGEAFRQILQEIVIEKRSGREYVSSKKYIHQIGKFATSYVNGKLIIPVFNPHLLYASKKPVGQNGKRVATTNIKFTRVPFDVDGPLSNQFKNMSDSKLDRIINRFGNELIGIEKIQAEFRGSQNPQENFESPKAREYRLALRQRRFVTDFRKPTRKQKILAEPVLRKIKVVKGNTLIGLLRRHGANSLQSRAILSAMKKVMSPDKVKVGHTIRFALTPHPDNSARLEPAQITISRRKKHLVTVTRRTSGRFVASARPVKSKFYASSGLARNRKVTSIYNATYHALLPLGSRHNRVLDILRIHAFDTDFRAKVRAGDTISALYDIAKDSKNEQNPKIGKLLMTRIKIGNETRKFYRFALPDGRVDFYDKRGRSARTFLMRKPVRNARLTSGFGYRYHPILKRRKLHKGVDWAGVPVGTPILAAGNGRVVAIKPTAKSGGYGNYVRLKHANGYQTAYAHLHKYAKGLRKGLKVNQGQIIGYLGNTGRSTAAHLHYEVLINGSQVNPMKMNVPRGVNLKGKMAAEFQKQRRHVDELLKLRPVQTQLVFSQAEILKK